MRHLTWMAVGGALLAACGPPESRLSDGTYQSTESAGALVGATLSLEVKARSASIALAGASPTALTLTELPRDQWARGCPTNFSSVTLETLTVMPTLLTLGPEPVALPRLVAGCGGSGANPDEVALTGLNRSNGVRYHFVFRRLTR